MPSLCTHVFLRYIFVIAFVASGGEFRNCDNDATTAWRFKMILCN